MTRSRRAACEAVSLEGGVTPSSVTVVGESLDGTTARIERVLSLGREPRLSRRRSHRTSRRSPAGWQRMAPLTGIGQSALHDPLGAPMERLSGLDAMFLYLETPTHHMHVAMTMVLDPATMADGYQFETLKEQVRNRLPLVPPFTRRPLQVPFRLAHPVWIEDPHFDLDNHVFRVGAPAPGGRRELADLAGQIASTPLPKDRPLWQIWVIEGLKHDRIGVVAKVHHSAFDGASAAEIMFGLFDFEPEAPQPPPPDEVPEPDHVPNDLELFGYAMASRARQLLSLPRLVAETTKSISRIVE